MGFAQSTTTDPRPNRSDKVGATSRQLALPARTNPPLS
jgi:hypothetical protein